MAEHNDSGRLAEQLAADWLVSKGYNVAANVNNETGFDNAMWSQLTGAGDQLRQRVGMALLDSVEAITEIRKLMQTEDAKESAAAFIEKRDPVFTGR